MGRKGAETKKRYKARAEAAEKTMIEERKRLLNSALPADKYLELRIQRIRAQLDRFDEMLLNERDPQKAQWLATVTAKLSEQERILAGRPAPGQLRPSTSRRSSGLPSALVPE